MATELHHGPFRYADNMRRLVNASATALNKKDQHDYKQNAANNANDRYVVHVKPPFLLVS